MPSFTSPLRTIFLAALLGTAGRLDPLGAQTFWVLTPGCDNCVDLVFKQEGPEREPRTALTKAKAQIIGMYTFYGRWRNVRPLELTPEEQRRMGYGPRDTVWRLIGRADSLVKLLDSSLAQAVPALRAIAKELAPASYVAIRALGWLGTAAREAIPDLVEALESTDQARRLVATAALGWMGSGGAPGVPGLVKLLADSEEIVRANAAEALGEIGPAAAEAVPALEAARHDPKGRVRHETENALKKIRGGR